MYSSTYSPTLCSYLSYWAERWPERLAVKTRDNALTWGEIDRNSRAIAAHLVQSGVQRGDRVGILMNNRTEFIEAIFGTLRAGAIVTLLNIRNTANELLYTIGDAGLSVIFSEAAFAPVLAECAQHARELRVLWAEPVQGQEQAATTFADIRTTPARADIRLAGDDIAFICYTSGTTGNPKGAMISHGNLIEASYARTIVSGITHRDNVLLALPMAYTGGLCVYIRDTLIPGATLYLENTIEPNRLLDVIEGDKITLWPGVPIIFETVLALPRSKTADYSHLQHAVVGGASVSLHLLQEFARIGVGVTQGYGLTESSGSYVAMLAEEKAAQKIGFTGKPVVNALIRVVDDAGNDAEPGIAGEILISGPTVMKGYFNKPDETAKTIVDGWLHSGDIGFFDDEGYLKIVDRKKDMLISGGLNVYPAELEHVLAGIGGMEEFVVIGVPDPKWGEVPMIIAHSDTVLDIAALRERCLRYLSDYKRPKYFCEYGQPLPRTYSGKILKREIEGRLTGVPPHAIDISEQIKRKVS